MKGAEYEYERLANSVFVLSSLTLTQHHVQKNSTIMIYWAKWTRSTAVACQENPFLWLNQIHRHVNIIWILTKILFQQSQHSSG